MSINQSVYKYKYYEDAYVHIYIYVYTCISLLVFGIGLRSYSLFKAVVVMNDRT